MLPIHFPLLKRRAGEWGKGTKSHPSECFPCVPLLPSGLAMVQDCPLGPNVGRRLCSQNRLCAGEQGRVENFRLMVWRRVPPWRSFLLSWIRHQQILKT